MIQFFLKPLKILFVIVCFLGTSALFFKFVGPIPLTINQTTVSKQTTFDVTGEGSAVAVPDTAQISLGVTSEATGVTEAKNRANQVINAISDKLVNLGIKKENIKTTNYNVYPKRQYQNGKDSIVGYTVDTNLLVKVEDLAKVNQAIDAATSLGANQIGQLTLTVNDKKKEELLTKAREEAIKQAKVKAESLARAAGVRLGKIVNISESAPYEPRPLAVGVMKAADTSQEATQIQPGETEIKTTITLSFEIL